MLRKKDMVVGLEVIPEKSDVLIATSKGYGKRVHVADFRVAHRGGLGVRTIPTDERNGFVIGLERVSDDSHVLLIDTNGKIIRLSPQEIRTMGRQAKGVRLVRLDEGQSLASMLAFSGGNDEDEEQIAPVPPTGQEGLQGSIIEQSDLPESESDEPEAMDE